MSRVKSSGLCVYWNLLCFSPCQMAILLDFLCMCRNVSPDYVGPIWLKVPRCNKHQVIVPYPHPALYLAPYPAGSHLAVCALYYYIVASNQLDDSSKKLHLIGHHHLVGERIQWELFFCLSLKWSTLCEPGLKVYLSVFVQWLRGMGNMSSFRKSLIHVCHTDLLDWLPAQTNT